MHTLIQLLMTAVALSTPCADESMNNCYWDAPVAGNGVGHTYIVVADDKTACITYPGHAGWNYCEPI